MNNRILSQKKAALMKYRIKIRRYTSPGQFDFAKTRLMADYLRIDMKAGTNFAEERRLKKEMLK